MNRSRLPVSTSVRRPTSVAKGSTSFGINRPSAIPSTLRKYANELFTPQTKTPRTTYGASTAGKSYRPAVATEKKYKRPLPEREELQQMFDTLLDYLRTHAPNLPLPEAKKFFSSVSTTESTRIFQLLISAILPDFKITRLETDVPEALAALDYPYIRSVTKSSLVSVTSRSAAASLLVIFNWLIKLIQSWEKVDPAEGFEKNINQDERNEVLRIKFSLPNGDRDVYQEAFEKIYPFEDRQTLVNEYHKFNEELEKISKEWEDIQELIQEGQMLDGGVEEFTEYLKKMEKYLADSQKAKEDKSREVSINTLKIDDLKRRKERKELDIRNHELSLDDVAADYAVMEQLESQCATLRQGIEDTSTELEQCRAKTNQGLKDEIQHNIMVKSNEIKRLQQFLESQDYPESNILVERKMKLSQWITRLDQLQPDDRHQVQRVFHDLELCKQEFEGTDHQLEAEIEEILSRGSSDLQQLLALNSKFESDIIPFHNKALKRIEDEMAADRLHFMGEEAKFDTLKGEADRQLISLQEAFGVEFGQLENDMGLQSERLKNDLKECADFDQLNEQLLRKVIEGNKMEEMNLIKEAEWEANRWEEARRISELNNKIAKSAYRLLKKRLNLDSKRKGIH